MTSTAARSTRSFCASAIAMAVPRVVCAQATKRAINVNGKGTILRALFIALSFYPFRQFGLSNCFPHSLHPRTADYHPPCGGAGGAGAGGPRPRGGPLRRGGLFGEGCRALHMAGGQKGGGG